MNIPTVGTIWKSSKLTGVFNIVGSEQSMPGIHGYTGETFVGHKAIRVSDGKHALVALTKKPKKYPYDWVLMY